MASLMALTIHRPWSDLIAAGHKRVENRTWTTAYRGLIAIHAGRAYDDTAAATAAASGHEVPPTHLSPNGIVAVARLVDVHHGGPQACGPPCQPYGVPGHYHWVLDEIRRLPEPIWARGRQGLWRVTDELAAQVIDHG